MHFGKALKAIKSGKKLTRTGWHGKDMYIHLVQLPGYDPCFVLRTAHDTMQPGWLPSQADLLAKDWEISN